MSSKSAEVLQVADVLYHRSPDWISFHREVLGEGGLVRRMFPEPEALAQFELSAEYRQLLRMVTQFREKAPSASENREPTRVITVRMPESLHESLKNEATQKQTSVNKLCITKLLMVLDEPGLQDEAGAEIETTTTWEPEMAQTEESAA